MAVADASGKPRLKVRVVDADLVVASIHNFPADRDVQMEVHTAGGATHSTKHTDARGRTFAAFRLPDGFKGRVNMTAASGSVMSVATLKIGVTGATTTTVTEPTRSTNTLKPTTTTTKPVTTTTIGSPSSKSPLAEVPTQVPGYWWSDAQSPSALTPATGPPSVGAEWSGWGQDDEADYGVPQLVSAAATGIAAPPAGDRVIKLQYSGTDSPFGADFPSGTHNMHKLYKHFTVNNFPSGKEPEFPDGAPADVSGRYITYLYIPSNQLVLKPGFWSNMVQFKEAYYDTSGRYVQDPSYWFGFNASDVNHPVLNLSSWGGRHQGPTLDLNNYLNQWLKVEMRVYQHDRLEVYVNDQLFDTAYNSEYPVGRMDYPGQAGSNGQVVAKSIAWTFGAGNYTNGGDVPGSASNVYVDLSTLLPLS